MLFNFQIPFTGGAPTTTVPDATRTPNLTIPTYANGKTPSAVAFYLRAPAGGNLDITLFGLVEDADDANAVDDFAEAQEAPKEWVSINSVTVTHGATPLVIRDLTPGRYYVRVSAGTATAGTLLGAIL